MNDNLVKQLREGDHFEKVMSAEQAADRIDELKAKLAKLRAFLYELWDSQGHDARELHDLLKELDGVNDE